MIKSSIKRTKVLIVLYYYDPYVSGLSIMAKHVAESLVKRGYQVTVLTCRYEKDLPKKELIKGVEVIRLPFLFKLSKGVVMPGLIPAMIKYAKKSDYVNTYLPLAESGLGSLFIPKSKIVTSYVCDINLGPRLYQRLLTFASMSLMRLQLLRSKLVIALSLDYLKYSKMRGYVSKSVGINPPISIDQFYHIDSRAAYKKINVSSEDIKIGFVGRIVYEKGINYLLGAIPYLERSFKNFKIILVGEYEKIAGGSIKDELDQFIKQYPKHIVFTGYLNDLERNQIYSGLDVFVLPSIDPLEAFGMVQVEAMLCGTPVVASNLPGVREVIEKTHFGRLSKIKDSEDIAKQIVVVVKDRKKYQPKRQIVESLFDPAKLIDEYTEAMPKILTK